MTFNEQPTKSEWVSEPNSTRNVLFGIGTLAIGSYVFLAITSRTLSPHEYSLFAAFWSVVMGLVLGATAPLETFGLGTTTVSENRLIIDRQFVDAVILVFSSVLVFVLLLLPWSVPRVFDGSWTFLVATILALVGFVFTYSARGILIVEHRSSRYAQLMSSEALLRIVLAVALTTVIGAGGSSVALGVALAALMVGLASYLLVRTHISLGSNWKSFDASNTETFRPLLVASLATLLLLNLGPFVVQFLAGAEAAAAGVFLNALTLSRVPIMLGPVLQARLVPSVVAILSREKFPTLGTLIGRGMRTLIVGGLTFLVVFTVIGKPVIDVLFGGSTSLRHLDLFLLAVPTFLYLIAIAFQSVLVALKETKLIAKAWALGLLTYLISLFIPTEAILKVEIAGVAAMCVVAGLLFSQLSKAMKSRLTSNTLSA